MACGGCRRRKKTSGSRTKSNKPKKITSPVTKVSVTSVILADRKKKCSRCPFNTVTGLSGRCKKVNRMISKAINDPSFKCPIKRF